MMECKMQTNNPKLNSSRPVQQRGTNVVDPHRTATEFRKLIVKLRWIGCEEQADMLEHHLTIVAPREFAFTPPADTD